jgi:LPS O-antigen subunit length determinant protein (WzzB/FepE family)
MNLKKEIIISSCAISCAICKYIYVFPDRYTDTQNVTIPECKFFFAVDLLLNVVEIYVMNFIDIYVYYVYKTFHRKKSQERRRGGAVGNKKIDNDNLCTFSLILRLSCLKFKCRVSRMKISV